MAKENGLDLDESVQFNDPTIELLEELLSRLNRIESKQDEQAKLLHKLASNLQLARIEIKKQGTLLYDLVLEKNAEVNTTGSTPAYKDPTSE